MEDQLKPCSKCGEPHFRYGQRYCLDCHKEYMRLNRPKHNELTTEQRKRASCRSYANVYKNRGKLIQLSCECCGDEKSQMHHEDYDKPLQVQWLCRKCHLELHGEENEKEQHYN